MVQEGRPNICTQVEIIMAIKVITYDIKIISSEIGKRHGNRDERV